MKVYVANHCTQASFEAEIDDPAAFDFGLEGMASPQLSRVSQRGLPEFTRSVKDEVEKEVIDAFQDDYTEAELRETFKWVARGWETPELGRPNDVFTLLDKTSDEPWAILVIQEVELS